MKCSLCNKEYEGYGNNALPLSNGRCCDYCNINKVIQQRVSDIINGRKKC